MSKFKFSFTSNSQSFLVNPSLVEEVYLTGKLFRDCVGLSAGVDVNGLLRPSMMIHDWLHVELGVLATEEGEDLIVTAEMHLYDPQQFHTEVDIPLHLYEQSKYMEENADKLMSIHNLLNQSQSK